ncbi:MAG: type II secretion system F family protein [Sporomusa sp.]
MAYINFTRFISEHPLIIFTTITLLFFAAHWYLNKNRELRDSLILNIPFYNEIHYNFLQYKFCILFRLLMNAGLSSVIALEKCADAIGNEVLANMLRKSAQSMRTEGFSLSQALAYNNRGNIFDPGTIDFFEDGDITVGLSDILEQQGEFFKSLVDTKSQDLGNKVGPIFICIGFAFVIYFIISVQGPILMIGSDAGV